MNPRLKRMPRGDESLPVAGLRIAPRLAPRWLSNDEADGLEDPEWQGSQPTQEHAHHRLLGQQRQQPGPADIQRGILRRKLGNHDQPGDRRRRRNAADQAETDG